MKPSAFSALREDIQSEKRMQISDVELRSALRCEGKLCRSVCNQDAAREIYRENREVPNLADVEQLPAHVLPGLTPALHLVSSKRRVSFFVCTTAVGLNHPRESVIGEGQ